ncbi:MAG: CotH kinase family protein [Prevotella sp.]|nr:CotH kinase family protein [Alistipes senegalensis]MCM1358460.1 CotH kinase family protein [Prevotella sp.]MCM1474123.1 CotH kinase family protein [Muribaculaceae bacterium]
MNNIIKRFIRIISAGIIAGVFFCIQIPPEVHSASGGISINEVCSENTFYKAPDGELYSWVEICNSSTDKVDLSGWGLSDDPNDPLKCTLAAGTVLKAGQKTVIFCSPQHADIDIDNEENILILSDRKGNEKDRITFKKTEPDTSYGQFPDGSGNYAIMECTPYQSNISPNEKIQVEAPELSHESGFYEKDFMLTINVPRGTTVYYTLDGSNPNINSQKYNAHIRVYDKSDSPNVLSARTDISAYGASAPVKKVDKAFVIRAVAVDEIGRRSRTVTASYFLGKTYGSYYKDMKVISIVTDPDNLFDYKTGIYVKGAYYDMYNSESIEAWNKKANYTQKGREWEREAVFEVFDKGKKVLSENVGIRVKGATSRATPQKSFNIYAREEYGCKEFDYDFFDGQAVNAITGEPVKTYDRLSIRNAGNDTSYSYLRDNINQKLINDRNLTMQPMNECIVFIDGEFWGFYTLTEKTDDSFIKNHYDIKKKNVAIIKNNEVEEGTEEDYKDWNKLLSKYVYVDMTSDENYKDFCSEVDIESFIEYFAVQIYWCNGDWPWNNFAVWRSDKIDKSNPYADGRWRMLLFDTDFTTGLFKNNDTSYKADTFARIAGYDYNISRMFTRLLRNPDFKEKFCNTFMDLVNYDFSPEKTDSVIEEYREKYRQQILDTCERFYASRFKISDNVYRFDSEMNTIKEFYQNRFTYATDSLKRAAGLNGSLKSVTLKQSRQGSIKINTITPDISGKDWKGQYFSDCKITITAVPEENYEFEKWIVTGAKLSATEIKSPVIKILPENDMTIKAVWKKS